MRDHRRGPVSACAPRCTSSVASPPSSRIMLGAPVRLPPLEDAVREVPVLVERLALVGEYRRAARGDRGGRVVLRRVDVARRPAHVARRAPAASRSAPRSGSSCAGCRRCARRAAAARGANSSRIAISPGISVSAIAISLRPQSASARSATLKSAKFLGFGSSIHRSLRCRRATAADARRCSHPFIPREESRFNERGCKGNRRCPTPSLARHRGRVATLLGETRDFNRYSACVGVAAADQPAGAPRQHRVGEARLALVEALGVERLFEREQLVVEVMANFVAHRAQEALERDDLALAARCASTR